MKHLFFSLLVLFITFNASAQDDLFGKPKEKLPVRKGWIIGANVNYDFPGGDMAKRFGSNARVGPSLLYKTTSNWVFGVKFDYIFGNTIKQDSFLSNLKDQYGTFITNSGNRSSIRLYERGYLIGLLAGKIINIGSKNPDNGLLLLTSVGFVQHKINIYDQDKTIPQLDGDYAKGYDRLTNGLYIEEYVAYTVFARDGLINFNIGLDAMFGFTQGRRDYLFDVKRPDNQSRMDMLLGIRAGFQIPIFKRKSEEMIF